MRNRGQLIGSIAGTVMGTRVRSLMMIVIFLLLLMVNAVFGVAIAIAIANMMIKTPSAVLPVWGALIVAFIIGQCIYRYKMNLV